MRLQEYQTKGLLSQAGVPVPAGRVAESATEARQIAEELAGTVVVKAQIPFGGRGKAGGVLLAEGPDEAHRVARDLLGHEIKHTLVRQVLVENAACVQNEIYVGIVLDRERRSPVMMASGRGGTDIEDTAQRDPSAITTIVVHPFAGMLPHQARTLFKGSGLSTEHTDQFVQILGKLYDLFWQFDGELLEVNPLALTKPGGLLALDAKMVIDDNSLFRHQELSDMCDSDPSSSHRRIAAAAGISYVRLHGTVACMVNGAGLAMAAMDQLQYYGASPADFLDVGGGATAERVGLALRLALSDRGVRSVLISIFGGITRCDEVARGLVEALQSQPIRVPVAVRLAGTNAKEGLRILRESELPVSIAHTLQEVAQRAAAAAGAA